MKLTHDEASQLLYREARYMDAASYDEWLSLWAADGVYWVPANDADNDPSRHFALVYLDLDGLRARFMRLVREDAYAQNPPSRLCRVVSNVEVEGIDGDADRAIVHSTFNLTELRRGDQHTFAGRSEHQLLLDDGAWKIERKKVVLVNLDEPIGNLSFLV